MMKLDPDFLRGSYPPLLTPFTEDGEVDYDQYAQLVEFQIRQGSHGIVVNGTTAEPSLLSLTERKRLLEIALQTAAGRVPIVAATGSQSFAETAELCEHAERVKADALLIVTPYYVRPSQRGLVAYYQALARRASLPFLIYHIPGRAAVGITIETLRQIAAACPTLVGMKHATPSLDLVTEAIVEFGGEFRILVGLEEFSFPMLAMGASGMVNAVSNIAPDRIVALYDAVVRGDLLAARQLHFDLFELNRAVFFDTNPVPMKYMAKRLGILRNNHHRLPLVAADKSLQDRLDTVLLAADLR